MRLLRLFGQVLIQVKNLEYSKLFITLFDLGSECAATALNHF